MKISIIIPTLGRLKEVDELLQSMIDVQNYSHEVIVVDQNFNNSLDHIISQYTVKFNIKHYKVDFRSLSKAKNYGIRKAKGELICFPDDDSLFLERTLSTGISFLDTNSNIDVVFGKCIDFDGNDSVIKFNQESGYLYLNNFEGKFVEATMFARTNILKNMLFDENLGIGSFFGAEEGYDIVYRLLCLNHVLYFNTNIKFYHPQAILNYDSLSALRRVYHYRLGFAYLCWKHRFYLKYFQRLSLTFFYIPLLFLFGRKKYEYYLIEFFSLIVGFVFARKNYKMRVLSFLLLVLGVCVAIVLDFQSKNLLGSIVFLLFQSFSCLFILYYQNRSLDFKDIRVVFVCCLMLYSLFYPLVVLSGLSYMPNNLVTVVYLFGLSFSGLYFAFVLFPAKLIILNNVNNDKRFRFNPVIFNTFFFGLFILLLFKRGIPILSASSELSRTEIFETHSQLWVVLMFIINSSSIYILVNFYRLNLLSKSVYLLTTFSFILIHAQMGNRRDYLPIILSLVFLYLLKNKININFKIILVAVIIFIFSFWISISRDSTSVSLSNDAKVELAISSNEFIYPMQTLLFVIRDNYDFRLGQTYFFLPFQTLIPRAIYISKPKGLGSELVEKSTGGGQGFAYTPTTEAYLNFGYVGPFIVFFIFGRLLVKLVRRVSYGRSIIIYILFYSLIFDFMRGDFASFTYQLLVMSITCGFYNLLQRKFN